MKNTLTIIFLITSMISFSQIFPEPSGSADTTYNKKKKRIYKCNGKAFNIPFATKLNTEARRYTYNIALWDQVYQVEGREPFCIGMVTCHDCPPCTSGWKKIGRISFIRNNNWDRHKLNLGWKPDPDNYRQIKLSAYFHEYFVDEYVSHYLTNVHTNTAPYVDMFMSLETIALIAKDRAVVIRKPGMIPSRKNSQIHNTFFYGDNDKCLVHTAMAVEYRNRETDKSGFQTKLNNCKYITVNLSVFKSADNHIFHAYEEMYGSISNPNDVQTDKANYEKQQCIIPSRANITFTAGDKIYLYPGFHAQEGSRFEAKIVQKTKYAGYYDEAEKLNLPPLLDDGECNQTNDSLSFFKSSNSIIDKYIPTEFAIYPNPSSGVFNIVTEADNGFDIEVWNAVGRKILEQKGDNFENTKIDITSYPKGIYIIVIRAEGKTFTKKVVYN